MRKKIVCIFGIVVVVIALGVGIITNANMETVVTVKGENISLKQTISSEPSGGEKINLLSGDILKYASYENNYYEHFMEEFENGIDQDRFAPERVKISWESEEGAKQYTLKIATNKEMKNAKGYVTFENSVELKNLYANTRYYYQIVAKYDAKTVKSKIFNFVTANMTRTVEIDGVSNTRDIGGYKTTDGKYQVKQGMVYRGGGINPVTINNKVVSAITEQGLKDAVNDLGIKTELDLRGSVEAGGLEKSPLGDGVNYLLINAPYYIDTNHGINATSGGYREGLLTELQTFANKDNYPVYVHCSLGRDRTGTLIFLLEALAGMSREDIECDYYASFFSYVGTADGGMTNVRRAFNNLYSYIEDGYGAGNLKEGAEKFVLELGLTQDEINSIRENLLEEVK